MELSSYCPGGTQEVNKYPYPHISVITKKSNAFDFGNALTLMEIKGDPSWNTTARWYPKDDTTLGPAVDGSNPKLVEIKSKTLYHLRCRLCCVGIDVSDVPSGNHGWHVSVPDSWVEEGRLRNHPVDTIHNRRAHFQTTSSGLPKPSNPEWRWYMQVDQAPGQLYELAEAQEKCVCDSNPDCNQQ